jgi:hypothetical protein
MIDDALGVRAHRITLQLRCESGGGPTGEHPVEGELHCEDGSIRAFTGWLGLVNELERVVVDAGSTGAGERTVTPRA